MGWFRRPSGGGEGGIDPSPPPIQIDLGFQQRPWEVEMVVGKLSSDGVRVHLTAQAQIPEMGGGLGPKRCILLVGPEDEGQVRSELEAAGIL